MSIPSWAKVGARVVCVDPIGSYIKADAVYTICWVGIGSGLVDNGYGRVGVSVHLSEVSRPFGVPYAIERFRPVKTIDDDISEHFAQHLTVRGSAPVEMAS